MATSLLALLDDISTILDDVSVMAKVAAKKTSGVLGDDLALNAQQLNGFSAEKEIPTVWAVCKGSFKNKAILVPLALLISSVTPWAVIPLLMVGGAYLCFEGVEKLYEKFFPHPAEQRPVVSEEDKIKGAVRTDFILSAEIITITLGSVAMANLLQQFVVLSIIAIIMTVGVYGLVAVIIKLDDLGLCLVKKGSIFKYPGLVLVNAAPYLMKTLSIVGTIAMFLVGGGILTHGVPLVHHFIAENSQTFSPGMQTLIASGADLLIGVMVGSIVLLLVILVKRYVKKEKPHEH